MTGRRLLLLRHGRTSWNEIGRAQGHGNVELDDLGHQQAATVASYITRMRPSALWTSDLARARQTCAYVEQATGLSAKVDERFREYDVGARQGMSPAEFEAAFPEVFAAHRTGTGDGIVVVPGSETAEEVEARIVPALRESLESLSFGDTGVVVTHGASLKLGLLALLGWPRSQAADLRGVGNCAWVTLVQAEPDRPLRLAAYNVRAPAPGRAVDGR